MGQRNILGGQLEPCGMDPLAGRSRDGCCTTGLKDLDSHTVCVVVTAEFLEHQRRMGNDLSTPRPEFGFPGLVPGDRRCVSALGWASAYLDGAAAPVVLASTNESVLDIVPLAVLRENAVDILDDPGSLERTWSDVRPEPFLATLIERYLRQWDRWSLRTFLKWSMTGEEPHWFRDQTWKVIDRLEWLSDHGLVVRGRSLRGGLCYRLAPGTPLTSVRAAVATGHITQAMQR